MRKEDCDHHKRLFSSLGEGRRNAFLCLSASEWVPRESSTKIRAASKKEREIDVLFPNRGLLRQRQVYLPLCLTNMGKRVGKSAQ